jgi:selenocysteine lyase/cysteine desulfurase
VDATHGIPFVDVRDEIDRIDYLVCAAYKHLLSPRGVSFLYIAEKHWDAVPPVFANWRSSSKPYGSYYGPPLDLAPDAARFDVSLAWLAWVGAAESLRLITHWQARYLLESVRELARELAQRLGVALPAGNIVVVPVDDADAVRERLAQEGVRASVRAGGVRLSPHVYSTREDIDRAVAALSPYVRTAVLTGG